MTNDVMTNDVMTNDVMTNDVMTNDVMTEREALLLSIERWDAIANGTIVNDGDSCPLCAYYDHNCGQCVVSTLCCRDTPYVTWYHHHKDAHDGDMSNKCPECVRLAKSEADFLRGLL